MDKNGMAETVGVSAAALFSFICCCNAFLNDGCRDELSLNRATVIAGGLATFNLAKLSSVCS